MLFTEIVMWMFLLIFFLCALLAIGSVANWIKVEKKYKNWLFTILIVEVIGCVILFGKEAFSSYNSPQKKLNEVLLNPEYRWYWQYAKDNWKTIIRFELIQNDEYKFYGETFYLGKDVNKTPIIIKWEGQESVQIPSDAQTIKIDAQRYYTEAASLIYPELLYEVNKKVDVQISLTLGIALKGSINDNQSPDPWGIVLIPGYQRPL